MIRIKSNETSNHNSFAARRVPIRLKCIVLGSAGAGKTSILRRYFHQTFELGRNPTIGADFYSRQVRNPVHVPPNTGMINGKSARAIEPGGEKYERKLKKKEKTRIALKNSKDVEATKSKSRRSKKKKKNELKSSLQIKDRNAESGESNSYLSGATEFRQEIIREPYISLQMWDTAGLERFVSNTSSELTASLGNSFFRHANVAMLVYDATSTRSFTQLINWYSELVERVAIDWDYSTSQSNVDLSFQKKESDMNKNQKPRKFPVLVVGNKLDILNAEVSKPLRRKVVPQRDVMGFHGKHFRGKDSHYEYGVSTPPKNEYFSSSTSRKIVNNSGDDNNKSITKNRYNQVCNSESLSYGFDGEAWTKDHSYLDSIRTAEDGTHPDRDLVILWCRRNGLKHIEVSALDGTGIDLAIESIITLALESMNETIENEEIYSESSDWNINGNGVGKGTLDFHERYQSKDECNLFRCLFPFWC